MPDTVQRTVKVAGDGPVLPEGKPVGHITHGGTPFICCDSPIRSKHFRGLFVLGQIEILFPGSQNQHYFRKNRVTAGIDLQPCNIVDFPAIHLEVVDTGVPILHEGVEGPCALNRTVLRRGECGTAIRVEIQVQVQKFQLLGKGQLIILPHSEEIPVPGEQGSQIERAVDLCCFRMAADRANMGHVLCAEGPVTVAVAGGQSLHRAATGAGLRLRAGGNVPVMSQSFRASFFAFDAERRRQAVRFRPFVLAGAAAKQRRDHHRKGQE